MPENTGRNRSREDGYPRIGVALWMVGDRGPAGFEVASAAGLDYVEIDMGGEGRGPDLSRDRAVAEVTAASDRFRLPVAALAVNRANDLGLNAPDGSAESRQFVRILDQAIIVAERLRAPRIILPGFRRSLIRSPQDARRTTEKLRLSYDRLQSAGLKLSYESELDAAATLALIRGTTRPRISLQFDTGNPAISGRDAAAMWPLVAAFAAPHVHVKDAAPSTGATDVPLGDGIANLDGVFAAFTHSDMPKGFTLEGNYRQDGLSRLQRDLARLRALVARLLPNAAPRGPLARGYFML